MICLTGCNTKISNQTIDDKISAEIQYLDRQTSNVIDSVQKDAQTSYKVKEENKEIQSNDTTNSNMQENSGQSGKSDGSNNSSKENINDTSIEYEDYGANIDTEEWKNIKKDIEDLYTSLSIIQDDVNIKSEDTNDDIISINKNIDNMLLDSTNMDKNNLIKECSDMYKNIVNIAEKVEYDNSKLCILKIRENIYKSYSDVLNDDWDLAKSDLQLAESYIDQMNKDNKKEKIAIKNVINSIDNKNKEIFFLKCTNLIDKINYLNE